MTQWLLLFWDTFRPIWGFLYSFSFST